MPTWNSHLSIKYDTGDGEKTITPIESFQPTFAMNAEPMHSVEAINIGVVYLPEQLNFSITVKAVGTATAELTMLAAKGTPFNIVMEEVDEGDVEWSLTEVLLSDCIITNANPSSAAISGAPTATFSGFALGGKVSSAADSAVAGAL
ncbi:hypothetical protein L0664_15875 [Octadecabacter sp. G9-8]|uniref:Uncharacterized protein n=1 Tax=Octadecabacter dasysiphoniae TaxID=2909341 RepID=A0ABS9CZ52_9RHOB|nr:hypothetical protein [Octadecabacter dasysiphoniae]MCF2872555.1 hypothetical protein [Octadecabacter dasysiphoniae]